MKNFFINKYFHSLINYFIKARNCFNIKYFPNCFENYYRVMAIKNKAFFKKS